ncbi:hypothetical protein ACH5RR_012560 [Cinchona calisaya]|uniref:Uncharacterized protein n=1 Tax=Cinchona calisaya TaxID=153742 RepID=A0ABD3A855_9GENT
MLYEASLSNKIDNLYLKTANESRLQPIHSALDKSIGGLLTEASLHGKINAFDTTSNKKTLELKPTAGKGAVQSLFPWDDSLTSFSIGGLLSETSLQARFDDCDPKSKGSTSSLQKTPLLDLFSSIFDAEEMCHAISFKKFSALSKDSMTSNGTDVSGGSCDDSKSKTSKLPHMNEVWSSF